MGDYGDWLDDPDAQAWASAALEDMLPKLRESTATVSIVPDEASMTDIKFAVELGLSIMLDKPIIAVVTPGLRVPEHLVRVADEIVELDLTRPPDADMADRLGAAIARVTGQGL